jgi:hypothetical protein
MDSEQNDLYADLLTNCMGNRYTFIYALNEYQAAFLIKTYRQTLQHARVIDTGEFKQHGTIRRALQLRLSGTTMTIRHTRTRHLIHHVFVSFDEYVPDFHYNNTLFWLPRKALLLGARYTFHPDKITTYRHYFHPERPYVLAPDLTPVVPPLPFMERLRAWLTHTFR